MYILIFEWAWKTKTGFDALFASENNHSILSLMEDFVNPHVIKHCLGFKGRLLRNYPIG